MIISKQERDSLFRNHGNIIGTNACFYHYIKDIIDIDNRLKPIDKRKYVSGQFDTRDAGAKSNKSNGINAVFEVDEAAEMAGNITNDSSAGADESN